MKVQVYGTGCANCINLEKTVKKAVDELDIDVEIEKVQDMDKILEAGLISMPGLAVDGEIKSMGRLPSIVKLRNGFKKKHSLIVKIQFRIDNTSLKHKIRR